MGSLRIVANYIEVTSILGFGHLQIVYDDIDEWKEIEVQSPLGAYWSNFPAFGYPGVQDHVENTSGYDDSENKIGHVVIGTGDRNPDDVWDLLVNIHTLFFEYNPGFDYNSSQNSNSYVNTLLWMVGIDVNQHLTDVTPPFVSRGFPGVGRNILTDGRDIIGGELIFSIENLLGTEKNDFLRTGDGDDSFSAGDGDDRYFAGDGDDTLIGGRGDDVLAGQGDFDTADYAQANDHSVDDRTQGIVVSMDAAKSGTVDDGLGGTDNLSSIEFVSGTKFDDVFKFRGTLASLSASDPLQFDGNNGPTEAIGDTIDLSKVAGSGVKVALETDADFGFVTRTSGGADNSTDAQIAFANVENAIGSGYADHITGNNGRNNLRGGGEADSIDGGNGHDEIHGGLGNDDLKGGEGADWIYDRGGAHPVSGPFFMRPFGFGSVGPQSRSASSFRARNAARFRCSRPSSW